jgi:HTH-type transcriptional regulator / antitoxin HipB
MSVIMDKLRIPSDLGDALKRHRKAHKLRATAIAEKSGRSRDTLNRLERGEDVTVKSMFDILRAMGLCIRLEPAGIPTLAEMRERFGGDDDGDE